MAGTLIRRYYALSIRARMAALVIACFLPAWLYVGYITFVSYQRQRAALAETLLATTRDLERSVDAEIAASEATMRVLASSPALDIGDYGDFHGRAKLVLGQTKGLNIVLLGDQGQQIINTLKPFGEPLPTEPPPFFRRVRETGQPVLSDLFIGPVAKRPLVSLALPIFRDGRLVHVLALSLNAETFAPLLVQNGRPDTWVVGIFDKTGTIVARSHSPEKYVGQKGVKAVLDSLQGPPEGLAETNILEGTPVVLAHSRSGRYGWTAVIGVPRGILEAEINRSLWISLITGVIILMGGLLLARRLAEDIAQPIRALIPPATAIGNGEEVTLAPLGLKEAEEVGQSLVAAAALIRQRTRERDLARTNEQEIAQQHRALRALSDIAALPDISVTDQMTAALGVGRRHFGMTLGIISRIEGEVYTILHHDSPPEVELSDGQTFQLGQTYCSITLGAGDVVAVAFMARSAYAGHPCYGSLGLESYIGAPISVGERRVGTVNFSSAQPRGYEFDDGDMEFMRLLARWIGSVLERDLTNREILAAKEAAEEANRRLAVQAERLTQSNADLEQFAYVASHDLRTPLRNVVSYAQLLERRYKGKLDGDADDFIGFIVDNSKKMTQLIADLLEYSRASGQSDPLVPVAAGEAVAQAIRNLKLDLDTGGAEITIGTLPRVMAVETHLVSLFQNLIGNAVKYRAPECMPRISVDAERVGADLWQFRVADNGIGIDPAYHDKIFEIFQRLDPTESTEGTGIGLTLCRRIVHRFGGTIWLDSKPGQGATFYFTLKDGG